MKKFVIMIIIFSVLCVPEVVKGEEILKIDDYDLNEVQETLDENEYKEIDFKEMLELIVSGKSNTVITDTLSYIVEKAIGEINLGREYIINIIMIALLSSLFTNFGNVFSGSGVSDTGFYICYIAIMSIALIIYSGAIDIATELLQLIVEFMQALIPAFFLSVGMIGQASALGFYQITLVTITVVEFISLKIVIPAIKIYLVIAVANNISKEDLLSKSIELIKKGIIFVNKTILGLVVGINIVQGMVLPHVDGVKNSTIKKLAGAIPVIGDTSEYVTDVFLNSGMLIKNSLGTAAIIILICVCAIPILKILLTKLSIQLSVAVIQPVADKRIVEGMGNISDALELMIRTLMTSVYLFVLSIAIVCIMTNIN